jgi:alpha-ketoglutarate-dependent taurine dioxygenase
MQRADSHGTMMDVDRLVERVDAVAALDMQVALNRGCPSPELQVRPEFETGDAVLFDERLIHRTFLSKDVQMTQERLAVECWFFAPSHPAEDYVALLA